MRRTITRLPTEDGWQIDDAFVPAALAPAGELEVLWQFAPAVGLRQLGETSLELRLKQACLSLTVDSRWTAVQPGSPKSRVPNAQGNSPLRGSCSDAFRRRHTAPYLVLRGPAGQSGEYRTVLRRPTAS